MRSSLVFALALGALGACSALGACAASPHASTAASTGASAGPAGPAGSAAGTGGAGSGTSTGVGFGGFTGSGGSVSGSCSSDLQSIVDDMGNVLKACPSDQGCANGACVPACTAALQSKGSIGCEFFAPDPPFYDNGTPGGSMLDGSCYAVFVANTWSRPAQIKVERAGQMFDLTQFGHIPSGIIPNITYAPVPAAGVPPGQVAVLFLSHKPGAKHPLGTPLTCPVAPAFLDDAAIQGSGTGSAFHVVSDTPVTAYDIMPYGGAQSYLPSASLLYPSTAWGTNYYVVAPHPDGNGRLWALLVGSVDGTKVTVAPTQTLPGGGALASAPVGQTTDFTINAGETLQWIGADPTGTVLQATQPIGVFTGSTELRVATMTSPSGGGHDSAHQQIPQISALGSEYVGPNVMTRLASMQPESIPYRLLGVVDGTTLTYDPAPPQGAPSALAAGQIVEFETSALFVVRSQDAAHPFGVTHYMPGAALGKSRSGCSMQPMFGSNGSCDLGDEDWVTLLPPKQFLQRYVFFTDPTYGTTNLVLTRVKGPGGFADVTIDCLGGPVTGWLDVGGGGTYQVAYVDLVRLSTPVAQCNGSAHEAKSKGAFGVTVWGTDWYASYGYPAGGNVGSINNVIVTPVPK